MLSSCLMKKCFSSQFNKAQSAYKDIKKILDVIYWQLILSSIITQNRTEILSHLYSTIRIPRCAYHPIRDYFSYYLPEIH